MTVSSVCHSGLKSSMNMDANILSDEFIFKLTHDRVIDWLLPGVPPTGKLLEIPMMGVINIRGDRLYHGKYLPKIRLSIYSQPFPTQSISGGTKQPRSSKLGFWLVMFHILLQKDRRNCVCQFQVQRAHAC